MGGREEGGGGKEEGREREGGVVGKMGEGRGKGAGKGRWLRVG